MISTYQRVEDLLNAVRDFHQQLTSFYLELSQKADKKKVKMLLNYMSQHERNFEEIMAGLNEEVGHRLLNTWLQFSPDRAILSIPQLKDFDNDISVDNVIDIAMELDDKLVEFYSQAEHLTEVNDLKDLFAKMKEQEKAEKSEVVKVATSIENDM